MACPFFGPRRAFDPDAWKERWTHLPRLPLGGVYSGLCHALPGSPHAPPEEHQRELCNCGYARGLCPHFPVSCAADAVRFSVTSDDPLRLVYILEKDHAPLEHGELDPRALSSGESLAGDLLRKQARAFVESYLKLRHSPK